MCLWVETLCELFTYSFPAILERALFRVSTPEYHEVIHFERHHAFIVETRRPL